jgi:hypothetical protein
MAIMWALDRDVTIELSVPTEPDLTHPTFAEQGNELVASGVEVG